MNGDCINSQSFCDNKLDCIDGSDEDVTRCGNDFPREFEIIFCLHIFPLKNILTQQIAATLENFNAGNDASLEKNVVMEPRIVSITVMKETAHHLVKIQW